MAAVEKLGGNWVIVRSESGKASDAIDASSTASRSDHSASRVFWTGDRWAAQYGFAKQFLTEDDAENHLAQHRHEMA